MYEDQLRNNWPGLVKETEELCEKLKKEDVNETVVPKKWWMRPAKRWRMLH